MTSRTGNKGFSLIEVMIAVALLSLGTLMIRQGFLRSADVEGRLLRSMLADRWMDEKAWDVRESLLYRRTAEPGSDSGHFSSGNKSFDWQLETASQGKDFYSMRLAVRWLEGQGPVERVREEMFTTVNRPGTSQ